MKKLRCVLGGYNTADACIHFDRGLCDKKCFYAHTNMDYSEPRCDGFETRPERCDVCGATEGVSYTVGVVICHGDEVIKPDVVCGACYNTRSSFASDMIDSRIMGMLKALANRARENV